MKEWKRIKKFPLYEASTDGEIKTFNWKNFGIEAIMKPALDGSGYLRTMLKGPDGKFHTIKVHRIIAETFCNKSSDCVEINHINGVKADNRAENLEWVTRSQNIKHSFRNGLQNNRGENNPFSKLTTEQVIEIRAKYKPFVVGRRVLAMEYGVKPTTIKDIVERRSWTHL